MATTTFWNGGKPKKKKIMLKEAYEEGKKTETFVWTPLFLLKETEIWVKGSYNPGWRNDLVWCVLSGSCKLPGNVEERKVSELQFIKHIQTYLLTLWCAGLAREGKQNSRCDTATSNTSRGQQTRKKNKATTFFLFFSSRSFPFLNNVTIMTSAFLPLFLTAICLDTRLAKGDAYLYQVEKCGVSLSPSDEEREKQKIIIIKEKGPKEKGPPVSDFNTPFHLQSPARHQRVGI